MTVKINSKNGDKPVVLGEPEGQSKFKRLKSLGNDKMRLITMMFVVELKSPAAVATVIQTEWQDFLDVKHATLTKELQRYYKSEIEPRLKSLTPAVKKEVEIDKKLEEAGESVTSKNIVATLVGEINPREPINITDGHAELIWLEKMRLNKLLEVESKLKNVVLSDVTDQMELLLKMYQQAGAWQLNTGSVVKVAKGAQVSPPSEQLERSRRLHTKSASTQDQIALATDKILSLFEQVGVNA